MQEDLTWLTRRARRMLSLTHSQLWQSWSGVALSLALGAWLLALLPWTNAPLAHLLALTAMLMGYLAWLRRDNRPLAGLAIALAVLAVLWRYFFWLLLLAVVVLAYGIWRARQPPRRRPRLKRRT